MKVRTDDGLGERKKKEKVGFKADRAARYKEKHRKEMEALAGKKTTGKKNQKDQGTKAIKELKFDEAARKEFLLGMHKRKNERRVSAVLDRRRKHKRETKQFRQQQREEARQQYNSYAKVPILPNYTFKLPDNAAEEEEESDRSDRDDDDDEGQDFDDVGVGALHEDDEAVGAMRSEVADVFARQATHDRSRNLSGLSLHTSNEGMGAVTVDVRPLFGGASSVGTTAGGRSGTISSGAKNKFVGGLDFSDLPSDVAQKLDVMLKEQRGPAQRRAKVNMVKEMQKIHKIKKHSRKKKK